MLIKESQLIRKTDILSRLNEAVYLTQEEASLNIAEIPVVVKENGDNLVDYCYIEQVADLNNCSIFEAATLIQENNNIESIKISVDEGDAIAMQEAFDPEHMVIKPLSEDIDEVFWCDFVSEAYLNDEIDEDVFIEAVICEDHIEDLFNKHVARNMRKFHRDLGKAQADNFIAGIRNHTSEDLESQQKQFESRVEDIKNKSNKDLDRIGKATARLREYKRKKREAEIEKSREELERLRSQSSGSGDNGGNNNTQITTGETPSNGSSLKYGAAAAGAGLAGYLAYKQYKNKPKSVIGKRIAALRKVYAKFMKKAQSSKDSSITNKLKKVAAKILSVIDKLLEFLQKKAG